MGENKLGKWSHLVVKKPPTKAGDMGLIPGWGRSPGEGMTTHSSMLAWRILQMEEPGAEA